MSSKVCVYSSLDGISLASNKKLVAVHLLTSDVLYFAVEKNCKVNELFSQLCRQLNLVECVELFGLCMRQDQCRWYTGFGALTSSLHVIAGAISSSHRSYNASQVEAAIEAGEAELAAQCIFLDPCAKLSKYACKQWKHAKAGLDPLGRPYLQVQLRVQFYVDSYLFLVDRVARLHYYLQLRRNLLEYTLSTLTTERAFLLASIALQADKGDRTNHSRSVIGFSANNQPGTPAASGTVRLPGDDPTISGYFQPSDYLPGWLLAEMGDEYVLRHLPTMHADQSGLTASEAQLLFIKEASDQAPHNLHMYRLFRHSSGSGHTADRIWLGICSTGVHLFEHDRSGPNGFYMRSKLSTFAWPDIGKLFFDKRKFEIRSIGCPIRKFTYFTCSEEMAKHLLWLCRVSHQFQLMIAPKLREMKRRENELSRKRYRESYIYSVDDQSKSDKQAGRIARRAVSSSAATRRSDSMNIGHVNSIQQLPNSVSMVNTKLTSSPASIVITKPEIHTPPFEITNKVAANSSRNNPSIHPQPPTPATSLQIEPSLVEQRQHHLSGFIQSSFDSSTTSNDPSANLLQQHDESLQYVESKIGPARSSACSQTSNASLSCDSAFVSGETTLRGKSPQKSHSNVISALAQLQSPSSFGQLLMDVADSSAIARQIQPSSSESPISVAVSCNALPGLDKSSNDQTITDHHHSLAYSKESASLRPSGSVTALSSTSTRMHQLPTFTSLSNFGLTSNRSNASNVNGSVHSKRFGRLASASKSMPNVAADLFGDLTLSGHLNTANALHRTRGAMTLNQTSPQAGSSMQSVFSNTESSLPSAQDAATANTSMPAPQNPMFSTRSINLHDQRLHQTNGSTCSSRCASDSDSSQGRVDMATSPMRQNPQHIYENVPFHRPPLAQSLTPLRVGPKIGISSLTRGMHLAAHPTYQSINGNGSTRPLGSSQSNRFAINRPGQSINGTTTSVFHSEPNIPNPINGSEPPYKAIRALSDPTALGARPLPTATVAINPTSMPSTTNCTLQSNRLSTSNNLNRSANWPSDLIATRANGRSIDDLSVKNQTLLPKRSPSNAAADSGMNRSICALNQVPKPALAWARSALHQSLCDLGRPLQACQNWSACNLTQLSRPVSTANRSMLSKAESSSSLLGSSSSSSYGIHSGSGRLAAIAVSRHIPRSIGGSTQAIYPQHSGNQSLMTATTGRFPLRQAESELQLNGSSGTSACLQLIPPPPDYASYINKQQRQQLMAASGNHLFVNGRLKATSEQQLNQHSNVSTTIGQPHHSHLLHHPPPSAQQKAIDLVSLRQRSHDLDLPLITALFNDRSLMLPKTVPMRARFSQSKQQHPPPFVSRNSEESISNCLPPHPPKYGLISPTITTSPNGTATYTGHLLPSAPISNANHHLLSHPHVSNHQSLMEMSCVDVTPVDLPPAQVQVLPLSVDSQHLSSSITSSSSSNRSSSSSSHPEQADRNHNTLNCNYNLPTKVHQPRNPTAEFIEKLWAEHFSQ